MQTDLVQLDRGPRNGWVIEHQRGSARRLHSRPILADQRRRVSLLEPTRSALVLGSTSREFHREVDIHSGAGTGISTDSCADVSSFDIVRRRSGGGLVWLDPAESTWLDVFVPTADKLWNRDVAHSFGWLGQAIAGAFASFGVPAKVHQGEFEAGPANGLICFGSFGHGEVVVEQDGTQDGEQASAVRKLVGISQRRTRLGSRFQCVWYRHFTLGAITQLADAQVCNAVNRRACGWASLGTSLDGVTSQNIVTRVIAHLTSA